MARVDEEGYYYMTGRKKNLIILDRGENVSPEELEKLLGKCDEMCIRDRYAFIIVPECAGCQLFSRCFCAAKVPAALAANTK